MATTVDERIVAAKFDASDFEKGVNKTVKKLDELKKSLNIKDETKNISTLAEKTKESADSMSKSLGTLTDRLTTFTGMIKQRILGGLADQVAGVFFKMEQSVTRFVRGISTDQISAGMSKYEQMLTSVRVMMSSGESEDASYKAIKRLQTYSDETSYSLSQMTDAMSKMRAAGVNLDDAAKNVEGIANACANAGINATDASRAFFNLSQAYSSGTLKYTDYRSLELLNMTTAEFKQAMLESAEAAGTLKKIGDGMWETINKNDKKVTAGKKVTEKNLSEMLRYNFMNTNAMNQLFGNKYWMEVIGRDELEKTKAEFKKLYGDNWETELEKKYGKLAVTAYEAAKEARSFTDVINALKDAVSSGWSTTFQHLFGKLSEAKEFFTDLSNGGLASVVYNIGEYRNSIIEAWDETDALGRGSGGEVFRQSIMNITEAIGTLLDTFLRILPGFDVISDAEDDQEGKIQAIGDKLFVLTMHIRDVTENIKKAAEEFKDFMTMKVFDDGTSRIDRIRTAFSNLSSVFTIAGRVIGMVFTTLHKAFYTLSPVIDAVINALGKITEPLVNLRDNQQFFSDIDSGLTNILTILNPIAQALGKVIDFLAEVGAFFVSTALDGFAMNLQFAANVLGFFMELITGNSAEMEKGEGILDRIRKDFEGIKSACQEGLTAVKNFFSALIGDLKTLLGLNGDNNQNGGIFAGLTNFFETNEFVQKAKAWVSQAITDVGNFIKSIPARLRQFGENIYDTLYNLFFTKESKKGPDGHTTTQEVLTPLGQWLEQTIQNIKEFILSIPQRIIDGVGKVTSWIDEIFNYLFGNRVDDSRFVNEKNKNGEWVKVPAKLGSRFQYFIDNISRSIRKWFDDLPNNINKALKGVGNFFTRLVNVLDEFLFGKKVGVTKTAVDKNGKLYTKSFTTRYKTGFSKWLDTVILEVKKFIVNIPEYVKSAIKGAGNILSAIVGAIFGTGNNEETTSKDVEEKLKKPFDGINLSNIISKIKEIGQTLLNEIAHIFTGTDDIESNQEWFSNLIADGIRWIRDRAEEALAWVTQFFSNLPTTIANFFRGDNSADAEANPIGSAIIEFGKSIGKFLVEDLPTTVLSFVDSAVTEFGKIWNDFYDRITGKSAKGDAQWAADNITDKLSPDSNDAAPALSGWQKFVTRLGETISNIWKDLPTWIAQGIELAITGINSIIGNLGKWIKDINTEDKAGAAAQEKTAEIVENVAESSEKGADSEEPRLVTAIKGIGEQIKKLFVEIIPGFISDAWDGVKGKAGEIFEGFSSIFTGKEPESELGKAIANFGNTIKTFIIETIPAKIREAFDWIGKQFGGENSEVSEVYSESVTGWVTYGQWKANDELKKHSKDQGNWTFFTGLKDGFLNALKNIGPVILEGIAAAFDFLSDIGQILINALTGKKSIADAVTENYKEETPALRNALVKIGESLKNFFLDILPEFIGSAIGTIAGEGAKWFEKLFSGMTNGMEQAAKDTEKKADPEKANDFVESANNVLAGVTSFIDRLNGIGNVAAAVLIIWGIVKVIQAVENMFSIANEAEAGADFMKWTAITVGIAAIAGIMGYITTILASGNEKDIEHVENLLDRLGDFFNKIQVFMGSLVLFNAVGLARDVAGLKKGAADMGKGADGFLGTLATIFGGSSAMAASGVLLADTAEVISDTFIQNVKDMGQSLSDFLALLKPITDTLLGMDSQLVDATKVFGHVEDLFLAYYRTMGNIYSGVSEEYAKAYNINSNDDLQTLGIKTANGTVITQGIDSADLNMKAYLYDIEQRASMLLVVGEFLSKISTAVKSLQGIGNVNEELKKVTENLDIEMLTKFMTDLFNAVGEAFFQSDTNLVNFEKLGTTNAFIGMANGLEILSNALSIFSTMITELNNENITAFDSALEVFRKLSVSLGDVSYDDSFFTRLVKGNNTLSNIGSQIRTFGYYIKDFYGYIKEIPGFEPAIAKQTEQKIDSVITITKGMSEAMAQLDSTIGERMSYFASEMPATGKAIADFVINLDKGLNTLISTERLGTLSGLMSGIGQLGTLFGLFSDSMVPGAEIADMIFKSFGDPGGKLAASLLVVVESTANAFKSVEAQNKFGEAGTSIAGFLATGIKSAFDSDPTLHPTIKPVLDMTEAASQLKTFFGMDQNGTVDVTALLDNINAANPENKNRITPEILDQKIKEVTGVLNVMNDNVNINVGNLSRAIAAMSIVIDGRALVGSISTGVDQALGQKMWMNNRGIAVPDGTP